MNRKSALYKALEARGASRGLSDGFASGTMARIMMAEHRRRRRMLWWCVGGYVLASAVCVGTLVHFCGGIIAGMVSDMAAEFAGQGRSQGGFLCGVFIPAALLLLIDGYVRHRRRQHLGEIAQNEN